MDRLYRSIIAFNRTNIKQKKYPAKLFYLQDNFFCKRGEMIAKRKLLSDLFERAYREPANTSICYPDFIPPAYVIHQLNFGAFV